MQSVGDIQRMNETTHNAQAARGQGCRTKTWKIGEECVGGIIRAKATKNSVKIEICDWSTGEVIASNSFGRIHIGSSVENWLFEFTTPYHAEKVREWIAGAWSTNPKLSAPIIITARLS